jgi:hypothetical protein
LADKQAAKLRRRDFFCVLACAGAFARHPERYVR